MFMVALRLDLQVVLNFISIYAEGFLHVEQKIKFAHLFYILSWICFQEKKLDVQAK